MGEAFITRRGGAGGYKPKIYVQTSQPAGKNGEFWVQDSGYTLDSIVADVAAPATLSKNALYLQISTAVSKYRWVAEKGLDLTSHILYGQAYYGGWKGADVYLYSGGWKRISKKGNRIFGMAGDATPTIIEIDPVSFSVIKSVPAPAGITGSVVLGGTRSCLFGVMRNVGVYKIDPETLAAIQLISSDGRYGVGGTSSRVFCSDNNSTKELDPNTLAIIKTGGGFPYAGRGSCDGTENRIFFCLASGADTKNSAAYEYDENTLAYTGRAGGNAYNANCIGGTRDALFIGGSYTYQQIDITTLAVTRTGNTSAYKFGGVK